MSRLFFATLSFMSRLPVPQRWSQGLDLDRYVSGVITFPFIGLLLGALSGLVFIIVQAWCGIPQAAFFAVLALALLTGASIWMGWRIPATAFSPHAVVKRCWKLCATAAWALTAAWR